MKSPGKVSLVGAGPGDPGLITLRGRTLLEQAAVVVYDHLASPQLLSFCLSGAEIIYVGKRAAEHAMTQEQINQLLIDRASQGKRVVRLKGGDPFVFGRGGEECEALAQAGIPFEVVPGVTAAIGGAAYAGIPITHRDFNSSVTLVTGHEKEDEYKDDQSRQRTSGGASDLDWASLAKFPCIVFYMGVKSLPRIAQRLIEHGMPADMPAAAIRWATQPRQRTIVGTLATLPRLAAEAKLAPPAITIVGNVVALRQTLNWFESRPLFGQTIVVTRTRQQASELSSKLSEFGARVIEAPTIELHPPSDWREVDHALAEAHAFDWVIFTSANGVTAARDRLRAIGHDARIFGDAKIAAIGDATASAVQDQLCLRVDLLPEEFVAEALADALIARGEVAGKRFLLLTADIARPILRERLAESRAAQVREVAIYETCPVRSLPQELLDALAARELNWITFTSSSTARNFATLLGNDYRQQLSGIRLVSIGPITSGALRELGFAEEQIVQAKTFNIDGVVQTIVSQASNQK